jgi:hypothetical protein
MTLSFGHDGVHVYALLRPLIAFTITHPRPLSFMNSHTEAEISKKEGRKALPPLSLV